MKLNHITTLIDLFKQRWGVDPDDNALEHWNQLTEHALTIEVYTAEADLIDHQLNDSIECCF